MIPRFVQIGGLAVLLQLAVIGVLYQYHIRRFPLDDGEWDPRVGWVFLLGTALVIVGQVVAIGVIGWLQVAALSMFSFEQILHIQSIGLGGTLLGYGILAVGFIWYHSLRS